jgi:glycosyltransferase involved in cell wall biosynthesis
MKILILNWRDIKNEWAGGGEVYVFELAKRWVKMGHKVSLFCGQNISDKLSDEETIDGIKIYRKGGRYTLYFWAFIYYFKKLRKECDVIIDVQNGIPFFSTIYSRKPKVAVVYHIHGKQFFIELPFPLNTIGYLIERFFFPLFYLRTKIIAISQTTKDDLLKLGFPSKSINIVYCGMNSESNKAKKFSKKFTQPTILYLGRIKKYKRVDMLVRLMPEISRIVPNARLLIAGWGTEASNIVDMSMRSSIRKKFKILGPVSDSEKRKLLSKSWLFVNPSIGEGWSISVMEANMHKTPAIAFNVAGLSESIRDGITGFLVENERDFVNKIWLMLTDKKLREKLSRNASKWAKTFSWDNAAEQSIRILKKELK